MTWAYTSPLKTNIHYRRLGRLPRSGSCDRRDPDVAINACYIDSASSIRHKTWASDVQYSTSIVRHEEEVRKMSGAFSGVLIIL